MERKQKEKGNFGQVVQVQFKGKVDKLNLDVSHFSKIYENTEDGIIIYEGVVNVKMLKRNVKCVIVHEKQKNEKIKVSTFFSTDILKVWTVDN